MEAREILTRFKKNEITLEEAEHYFRKEPFEEMGGYAKLDSYREVRSGFPEVIFCSGKADEHFVRIFQKLYEDNGEVFGTRASRHQYDLVKDLLPGVEYDDLSHIIKIEKKHKEHIGKIAVCTAGTADIPVAEEAAQTAEYFGTHVERIFDVGVSGIHRLFSRLEVIQEANCVVAVAGMDRSPDFSGIWSEHEWTFRTSDDDQFLREWDCGGKYRQWLRGRLHCNADQPPCSQRKSGTVINGRYYGKNFIFGMLFRNQR